MKITNIIIYVFTLEIIHWVIMQIKVSMFFSSILQYIGCDAEPDIISILNGFNLPTEHDNFLIVL